MKQAFIVTIDFHGTQPTYEETEVYLRNAICEWADQVGPDTPFANTSVKVVRKTPPRKGSPNDRRTQEADT